MIAARTGETSGKGTVVTEALHHETASAEPSAVTSATLGTPVGLSAREQQMLDLERQWWKYAGAKEQAIREKFELSATHYYQVLNALIDTEAALAYDPMLVKRLRRLRLSRQQARSARRLGN